MGCVADFLEKHAEFILMEPAAKNRININSEAASKRQLATRESLLSVNSKRRSGCDLYEGRVPNPALSYTPGVDIATST